MGPSGSGKDSLLSALRQREHPQLLVAHRYITRAANAAVAHIALSEQEFSLAPGRICSRSAGTPTATTGSVLRSTCGYAGFDVLVNGSRAHLPGHAPGMPRRCCRSVCRFRRMSCAAACKAADAKAKKIAQRLERAARYTQRIATSSTTTEVCYSQSITFYRLSVRRRNSMPDCTLRPATADDAQIVYALICELKQAG